MKDNQPEELNNCLRLYNHVPELVKLTSFKLMVDLWARCLQDPEIIIVEFAFKLKIVDLLNELDMKISDSTKHTIYWYSMRIRKLASIWVSYHQERIFVQNSDMELIRGMCLPEVAWRPDGSIDNTKSAEALLKSGKLNDEQEYRLVCLYCMEKRISNVWHRLVIDQNEVLEVTLDDQVSILSYWNSRMVGRFRNLSEEKSAENRLLSSEAVDNLSAAMYFFDRLEEDERVEIGCKLILAVKLDERAEYVRKLLSKFTNDELRQAFQLHCSDIVYPLITNRVYVRYAIEIWNQLKDALTVQSFLSVMTRFRAMIGVAYKKPVDRFKIELDSYNEFKRYIFTDLAALWRSTPDSLRKHPLLSEFRGVIHVLAEYYIKMVELADPDDRFLFTIIPDASETLRKRFMYSKGWDLLLMWPPRVMIEFLDVCYGLDVKGKNTFKKCIILKMRRRSLDKLRAKKFAQLDEYFETFLSERSSINSEKRSILSLVQFNPEEIFPSPDEFNVEEIELMRKFITDAYEDDPRAGEEFKMKVFPYCPQLWNSPLSHVPQDNESVDS